MRDMAHDLRERARTLDAEIERHLNAAKALEIDRTELMSALKTLTKHGLIPAEEPGTRTLVADPSGKLAPKKTVPEMILEILRRDFPDGAKPEAVLARVHERYDPNADPNNVRPTLWRMAKDGRLGKSGELYRLPETNEAAGSPDKDAPTASAQEHPNDGVFG